jgi:hypothetical protein
MAAADLALLAAQQSSSTSLKTRIRALWRARAVGEWHGQHFVRKMLGSR